MKWILIVLASLFVSAPAFGQDPNEDPTEIYVSGDGTVAGDLKLDVGEKLILDNDQEGDDWIESDTNNTLYFFIANSNRLILTSTIVYVSNADLNISTAGKKIYNSGAVLSLGSACTTSHSLVTGDVCFGAGAAVEFDDAVWFDSTSLFAGDAIWNASQQLAFVGTGTTRTAFQADALGQFILGLGTSTGERRFIIGDRTNLDKEHHFTQTSTPTLTITSVSDVDSITDENISITHNVTDGQFDLGSGDYRFNSSNGKSSASYIRTKTESVTFSAAPGDASQVTVGSIIPDGAFIVGVSSRVVTANTGGCTSMDIGVAAVDTDHFADNAPVTNDALTTNTTITAALTAYNPALAATEITVTAVGGDGACDDMVVAITVHYIDVTAASSD